MEVNVTCFNNPHQFWFFELKNTKSRQYLEQELQSKTFQPLNLPTSGQIALVYDGKWKRALVKSTTSPYSCWLLDYGVHHEAQKLHIIPDEFKLKPCLAKKASLLDVVCLNQEVTPLKRVSTGVSVFNSGCIRRAKEHLTSAEKTLFKCSKESDNVHFGHLTLVTSTQHFDLTEALISDRLLLHDPLLFVTAFRQNCDVDMSFITTTACSPKLLSKEFIEDIQVNSVGRGISRMKKTQVKSKRTSLEEWVEQSKWVAEENLKDDFEDDTLNIDFSKSDNDIESSISPASSRTLSTHEKQSPNSIGVNSSYDSNKSSETQKSFNWSGIRAGIEGSQKLPNVLPAGMSPVDVRPTRVKTKTSRISFKEFSNNELPKKESTTSLERIGNKSKPSVQTESVKDVSDYRPQQPIKCVVGCKCEQCIGWNSLDMYFNEKKKRFEDAEVKQEREFVKPLLLLKTDDNKAEPEIHSCVRISSTKIKRSIVPTVLVHGSMFLSPASSILAAPFHQDVHKALRSFDQVYSIQSYVWPALMRNMNVCLIANGNCGKTMAYLPAICSFQLEQKERYPNLPQNCISPITVIVCPGVQVAEKVFYMILKLLENASTKSYIVLAVQPIDMKCLNQFKKQVDILVATPTTLTSLISTKIISMKRLCHFVIEKANIVLERFRKEIEDLLLLIQSMLLHRNCNYSVQMIVTSEQWSLPIEALLKSLNIVPVIAIASYLEAAMYGRVDLQIQFLESQIKMSTLANLLKGKSDVCRTVVICNTQSEIEEVREYLLISGINCLYITDDMETNDIDEVETRWMQSIGGKHLALICTEKVFTLSINITNAVILVNYSLPNTWTQFVNRFRCMLDNYISPLVNTTPDNWTRCRVHIFVDESCSKQFIRIAKLIERLGGKLTPVFQNFYQKTIDDREKERLNAKTPLCKDLKLFGKCESIYCLKRHMLCNDRDYAGNLPKNGVIKFRIVHIHDVVCFAIKLLEVTDVDGKQMEWKQYNSLQDDLNVAMKKEKNCVFDVKPGGWYAYHLLEEDTYVRCAVRRIISVENITKRAADVSIRCLDTGRETNVSCAFLYKLPPQFQNIPPQVIDVYVANLMPSDYDDSFSHYSKSKVEEILKKAGYNQENTYEVAQILLQLAGMLWLKNVMVYEELETSNLRVNKLNLRKTLLHQNLASLNERQLPRLYKLCKNANIELPNYTMSAKSPNIALLQQQFKPQWAHFGESDCTEIYIAYADTPSLFYVRLKKFYDLFTNLQQEIQDMIAKPLYPCVDEVFVHHCYLAKSPLSEEYARCVVTEIVGNIVKVFFVDYGDYANVDKTELKYLPDELIAKLPFQAIECRLYGVEPVKNEWSLSAIGKFCDFVFEPDTDYYRTLYTTSCKQEEPTVKGSMKYAVLLVDSFTQDVIIINKMLIDCGVAASIAHENINTEFSLLEPCAEEDENIQPISEEDKELTFEEINTLREKYGKQGKEEETIGEISGDHVWDVEINDPELFLKKLMNVKDPLPKVREVTNEDLPFNPKVVSPPADYCTPNIFWHQTNEHIKINVMLPAILKCDIRVIREKILTFGATYDNKPYKLELFLFDNVEKTFQYTVLGTLVKIILKKKASAEWPRLILSTEKMRYIKYDYNQCVLKEEKKRRFLDLGIEDDDDESDKDGVLHIEYGSDENYSESDYDSDFAD